MAQLTPKARVVLKYLETNDSVTSRDALMDIDMNSGSFTKRISELRSAGYPISDTTHKHPMSGRQCKTYTLHSG